jgi:hypothetical protein
VTFGAVDQTPSQTFAFAFLTDKDSYLLQDHKVAIDGALGTSEFSSGVRDGQFTALVEQTKQPLLPSQGTAAHRGLVYAWCIAAVKRGRQGVGHPHRHPARLSPRVVALAGQGSGLELCHYAPG